MQRVGYWATHEYKRLKVSDIEEFCGWKPLIHIVNLTEGDRNRGFIATLFETSGRVTEVLPLKRENFEIRKDEGLILVRGMPLLKRYNFPSSFMCEAECLSDGSGSRSLYHATRGMSILAISL